MAVKAVRTERRSLWLSSAARAAMAAPLFCIVGAAHAYVGPSFMQLPDVAGGWAGEEYKDWLYVDAFNWPNDPNRAYNVQGERVVEEVLTELGLSDGHDLISEEELRARFLQGRGMRGVRYFPPPSGPGEGPGSMVISVNKQNPVLPQLMEKCAGKATISEIKFAESSDRAWVNRNIGPRPEDIPEWYEYKFTDAQFTDCPIVEEAAEQAFVITFKDSAHLNYEGKGGPVNFVPTALAPEENADTSRAFVLSWFGPAHDIASADEQCPVMNQKPTDDDYYARLPKDIAEKERRLNNENRGGVRPEQLGFRGPNRLNIAMLPGIVEDPGHAEPQTRLARGLNLDGTEDGGATANTCQHEKFVSQFDGETMVDNQLYRVEGCVEGLRGHEGFVPQFANNNMRDGAYSMLVQISGVEDWENDDQVEVGFFYSLDPMAKSGSGAEILSNYTFRITEEPQYAHYHRRLAGRIVDGVVHTEPVDTFQWNLGNFATPFELNMADAQLRLDLLPDGGGIKGVLGGYVDWRARVSGKYTSTGEIYSSVHLPGYFNAFKRNADGLKDPVTGQCNGVSAAYDVEGERAFIRPAPKPEAEITQVTQATQATP